jgi:hypothetical protein
MSEHPGAISLGDGGNLTDKSAEVARIWVTDHGGASVWIDASLLDDPRVFGYLIAETIGHGAVAYADKTGGTPEDMLAAIVAGVSERVAAGFGPDPETEGKPN